MHVASSTESLDHLYRSHHGWLFGWLRKKTGCRDHAADLTQDTFLKLLALPEMPALREPRAYLLVTANRLLINLHQRSRVERETLQALVLLLEPDSEPSPEHIVAMRQLLRQVLLMLSEELEEKPRRAFLLARLEGLSYVNIAAELQVSESSVKQYLAKALAHCHGRLYGHL